MLSTRLGQALKHFSLSHTREQGAGIGPGKPRGGLRRDGPRCSFLVGVGEQLRRCGTGKSSSARWEKDRPFVRAASSNRVEVVDPWIAQGSGPRSKTRPTGPEEVSKKVPKRFTSKS
uniref:Uncharacterized protein n=1 Tax=Knipowitschia caucasica TaxID=637954 RepID=A0AAV2LW29_KNICA